MSHDARIDDLLEQILDSDRTAEEICAQCPELLSAVRDRLQELRNVEAQLDNLFPPSQVASKTSRSSLNNEPFSIEGDEQLPTVQGYEILAILGRGGMGVVYRAKHLKLNRTVALKMLLAGSHASPQQQLRFMREAEAVAGLQHPNIVQLYEFGEIDGQPYFTMEFVGGGSLSQKMVGTVQPVRDSALMLSVLAKAVFAAHRSGIVHRDLKPANILLAADNTPKISDFGLARRLNEEIGLTQTGYIVGTPNYMAPEQLTGSSAVVGPPADIFALGAILYEMLTGQPPFRGKNLSDTHFRLMMQDPVPPSQVNPKVPRDLETICLKCLEKDRQRRYASAGELAADLDRFLRYEPILARPVSPTERWLRWIRRNPLMASLIVTAVVLAAVLAGAVIHESSLASDRRAEKSRLTARLESGVELIQDERYAEARAILGELGDGGHEDLRQRINRTLEEIELVEDLDQIGVQREFATGGRDDSQTYNRRAVDEYAAIFARMDLGKVFDDAQTVAQRIRNSVIRRELVAALDDWALCESDETRRNWLLEVAQLSDPNASDWYKSVRNPAHWNDRAELARLASTAAKEKPSVQLRRALGDRLSAAGLDSIPFREQTQQVYAHRFLANFSLANALRETNPAESLRYYQAALAIRPSSVPALNNLAVALAAVGRYDEAVVHFEQALELAPQMPRTYYNLGLALFNQRKLPEAKTALQQCLKLLPPADPARPAVADLLRRCEQANSQKP